MKFKLQVVMDDNLQRFEKEVKTLMGRDWRLHGSRQETVTANSIVSVKGATHTGNTIYMQTLIKGDY